MSTYEVYFRIRRDKTALEFDLTINAKSKKEAHKIVNNQVAPEFVITEIKKVG